MKKILLFLFIIFSGTSVFSQKILYRGVINYERKVNMHKQIMANAWSQEWAEKMLKKIPKYKTINFDLTFNQYKSVYKKSKTQTEEDPSQNMGMFGGGNDKENEVYKNIDSNKLIAQKQMFEKEILLVDSLPKINWKLTNDFKTIAGYNCRKATSIMYDSVYVIAYYSDAIFISSGPESFSGLPGTIMGLVLPRLNTTYFATKVQNIDIDDKDLQPITKGEKNSYKDVIEKVKKASADWGNKSTDRILWSMLL